MRRRFTTIEAETAAAEEIYDAAGYCITTPVTETDNTYPTGCDCEQCPLLLDRDGTPVPAINLPNEKIIIAEAPGHTEIREKKPLVGAPGEWLRNVFARLGENLNAWGRTNTLLCKPPAKISLEDYLKKCAKEGLANPIDCCRGRLLNEIKDARVIITLGNAALRAITGLKGIKTWRGSPLRVVLPDFSVSPLPNVPTRDGGNCRAVGETWVLPTLHPAFFMHSLEAAVWENVARVDLAKFVQISRNDKTSWDETGAHPIAGAYELLDALHRANSCKVIAVDIETKGGHVLDTDLLCIGIAFNDEAWVVPYLRMDGAPWEWPEANGSPQRNTRISTVLDTALRQLLSNPNVDKVLHNGIYDETVLERLGYTISGRRWDTMFMHHAAWSTLPHSLAFVASIYTQGRYWKSDIKDEKPWRNKSKELMCPVAVGAGEIALDTPQVVTGKLSKAALLRNQIFQYLVDSGGPVMSAVLQDTFTLDNKTIAPRRTELLKMGLITVVGKGNKAVYAVASDDPSLALAELQALKCKKLAQDWSSAAQQDFHLYNCRDTLATLRSCRALVKDRHFIEQRHIFAHEMALTAVSREMTRRGMLIDFPRLEMLRRRLVTREAVCVSKMQKLLDTTDYADRRGVPVDQFWPTKPKDIACALSALGVPITKRTAKTGAMATDKDTIAIAAPLSSPEGRDFIRLLTFNPKHDADDIDAIGYRSARKLRSTYLESLPVLADGRMHADWKIHGTLSGRFSASPNLMNWTKWLRSTVVAPPGYMLCGVDYSQIELRIQAYLSGDPLLLRSFESGDPHSANASLIFGLPLTPDFKLQHKHERDLAKRYIYALGYGAGDETIWQRLLPDYPSLRYEMVEFVGKRIKATYRQWMAWREDCVKQARKDKMVESAVLGRRRYFTGEVLATECLNFPAQSTAADVVNLATIELFRIKQAPEWAGIYFINQCHDALVAEVPEEKVNAWKHVMETVMPGPWVLKTPRGPEEWTFPVDAFVGHNWAEV